MLGKPGEMRAWMVPAVVPIKGRNRLELEFDGAEAASLVYLDLAF
jgi:hypothetical protein